VIALLFILITFLFGTFVGSFLNVVIFRFNTGRTLGGRSRCQSCGKTLRAHELVPVLSYCVQRGKCTTCSARISPQYPIVEALTGLLFTAVFWKYQFFLVTFFPYFLVVAGYSILLFVLFLIIFFYDIRHQIIPNTIVYPLIALSFFAPFVYSNTALIPYTWSLLTFISGPLVALPLFLLWAFSKGQWLGFGDVKLAVAIGYLLGVSAGFASLMIGFWIGGIVGIILLVVHRNRKKVTMKTALPFAPFLIVGCALAFFFEINLASLVGLLQ
jgi:leader peptidase (prepilin peptidase)/N-methyltransferase